MHSEVLSTSFGRRALSHAQISTQQTIKTLKIDASADKWTLFRTLRAAAPSLGLADRALTILNALLSFYPERMLRQGPALVVFPSNVTLAERANGISAATLRRHIALLVEKGIIIRRDSPNGKRYARRAAGGKLDYAYGFDLTPLIARQAEFEALAEAAEAQRQASRRLREQITTSRRTLAKGISFLVAHDKTDAAARFQHAYAELSGKLSPRLAPEQASAILEDFSALLRDLGKLLENITNAANLSAIAPQNERHKEDPTPDKKNQKIFSTDRKAALSVDILQQLPNFTGDILNNLTATSDRLLRASDLAARLLAIPTTTVNAARLRLGSLDTALAIAMIYELGEKIAKPSAYLIVITNKIVRNQQTINDFLPRRQNAEWSLSSQSRTLSENRPDSLIISDRLRQFASASDANFRPVRA
ncbi:plasmid replication protein RepC [Martelella sp. HB161492]|uniref:plasmid replication protein RepC n=1 Tax=Martelella sp. HB161492 TaxID=2720726 RepID=UPI001590542C|nr:plasmid replication protein RepC [Martelella sp. HB161492]